MTNSQSIGINLEWPPSANTYWRRNGGRYFISNKGQNYRQHVLQTCLSLGLAKSFSENDRLRLSVLAFPPDKRRRDLDNLFKSILDSLQWAKVFNDDSQIDELSIKRMTGTEGFIQVNMELL